MWIWIGGVGRGGEGREGEREQQAKRGRTRKRTDEVLTTKLAVLILVGLIVSALFEFWFETCGCLSNNPLPSLRSRASESEPEKAQSKRKRNTNPQVSLLYFLLHFSIVLQT